MTITEMKKNAKLHLKGNVGTSLLAKIINGACHAVCNFIPIVGTILVHGPLAVGLQRIFCKNSRGAKSNLKDLFLPFKENFGESFLAGLLVNLFTFLWSLLFVIPGIVKSYSYHMTYYLMLQDPALSANEAIDLSRQMMHGNKGKLFLMDLSMIGWKLLVIITFGIAAIYVGPYISQAHTEFYNEVYANFYAETVAFEAEA